MDYRKGDLFVHKAKGTIAVITNVDDEKGTYGFKYSNPNEKGARWDKMADQPLENITNALDKGFVVMYRPYTNFLDDDMFKVD